MNLNYYNTYDNGNVFRIKESLPQKCKYEVGTLVKVSVEKLDSTPISEPFISLDIARVSEDFEKGETHCFKIAEFSRTFFDKYFELDKEETARIVKHMDNFEKVERPLLKNKLEHMEKKISYTHLITKIVLVLMLISVVCVLASTVFRDPYNAEYLYCSLTLVAIALLSAIARIYYKYKCVCITVRTVNKKYAMFGGLSRSDVKRLSTMLIKGTKGMW